MLDYLFPSFKKKNQGLIECQDCGVKGACKAIDFGSESNYSFENGFDPSKETILIIDDNPAIMNFLREDIHEISKEIDLSNYNVLTVTGSLAAFQLHGLLKKRKLNIQYAIIDITYTGSITHKGSTLRLSGLDVYKDIKKHSPDFKFLFYTNDLNPVLKINQRLMSEFEKLTGKKLEDYILKKTTLSISGRRDQIVKRLFKS